MDRLYRDWFPVRVRCFTPQRAGSLWRLPSNLYNGYRKARVSALPTGVMCPGHEADHSPPYSAHVYDAIIPPVPTRLHRMVITSLIRHRDNFTFVASCKWYLITISGDTVGSTVHLSKAR
jgi:hypothetical protein